MTRRGMKPTGIAIFEAQQKGFPSVAHFVQVRKLTANSGTQPSSTYVGIPALVMGGRDVVCSVGLTLSCK